MREDNTKRVVIGGGGFGGLTAATALGHILVHVTFIDRMNHHFFLPLLYQVAASVLTPGQIASPIRGILRNQEGVTVILGEVTGVDKVRQCAFLNSADREEVPLIGRARYNISTMSPVISAMAAIQVLLMRRRHMLVSLVQVIFRARSTIRISPQCAVSAMEQSKGTTKARYLSDAQSSLSSAKIDGHKFDPNTITGHVQDVYNSVMKLNQENSHH